MGSAATGNRARKKGKRYPWGAERPSVIERRVQLRKKQIDIEIAQIREEVEKKIARRVAAKEAERLKVLKQEALLEEHREKVSKSRASRRKSRYLLPEVDCTSEEIAAVMAENPGADEEVARLIIHKRRAQAGSLDVSHADAPAHEVLSSPSGSIAQASRGEAIQLPDPVAQTSKPVEASKVAREKPKPAPVHIEAAVAIASASVVDQYDESEGDWSDFDPEAWSRGEDYPEHLYEPVHLYDDVWELRPRADLQELPKLEVTPEIQSLRDEKQRLEDEIDALLETHGLNRMVWSQEILDLETVLEAKLSDISNRLMVRLLQPGIVNASIKKAPFRGLRSSVS